MKKIVLILSCAALIACNDSKKNDVEQEVNLSVSAAVSHESLEKKIDCGDESYSFEIPVFTSNTDADQVLNNAITGLITRDFVDVTYAQGSSLNSIYDIFTNRRERVLCREQKNEGLKEIKTIFVSDTEKLTSYELEYSRANGKGRILKTFLKPDLKEVYLKDIIPARKEQDIKTIFNANLQQAVANLVTEIPSGDLQNQFVEFVRNNAFQFETEDFETSGLAFQMNSETSKNLRLSKMVELPKGFEFLNNTVVVEIDVYQLKHYLDLSRIID